ncbi:MAG: aldehyde dehydrogenase family protein, partial [Planctomycetota bacterium]|nr:aldehyde dehydrogenase family protein [Planctomycetota bacterium]
MVSGSVTEFRNESFLDYSKKEIREAMAKALAEVARKAGGSYPLVIGGERIIPGQTFDSLNPSDPSQILGRFQKATPALAGKALEAANDAFSSWSRTPAEDRANLLFRAAQIMRDRRHTMNAWMVLEVGKSWAEADGETAESIDFLEFYGREMLRYAAGHPLTQIAGEENELIYIPLGAGVVIPPWNFPNAILCGMSSAAIVAGNTVVLKPSSDSPGVGYQYMLIMEEAGVPAGVLNYLTGPGSLVGETLVGN